MFGERKARLRKSTFIDKILVHEKVKEGTHFEQTIEIVYNFVGGVEIPDFN
ncbi:MAG: DUF4368 domain-containing protein [Clostridia bacterium]|nr:DUF4368 domain-containing protein [Clostridia bacterium]